MQQSKCTTFIFYPFSIVCLQLKAKSELYELIKC